MKNIIYVLCLFFSSLFSTREHKAIHYIKEVSYPQRVRIVEELTSLSHDKVVDYIGQDWQKMFFWFSTNSVVGKSFKRWSKNNPHDYWRLIESFDYFGQYQCFWYLLNCTIGEKENKSACLITWLPEEQLKKFVHQYFVQINQDIEEDKAAGRQLQHTQWVIPCKVLLKYKPEIFMWLLDQDPEYSFIWLSQSDWFLFDHWLKSQPEQLYSWIATHWQVFKNIITVCKFKYWVFWDVMLQADQVWILEHKDIITDIIACNQKALCYGGRFIKFMNKYSNFPFQYDEPNIESSELLSHAWFDSNLSMEILNS